MRTHSRYVLIVLGLTLVAARRGPVAQITYRTQEPVIIRASSMPRFSGKTVDWIRLYKWSGSWQEIPSQIDEFTPEHLKNYSTQGCIVDADPCETAVRLQGAVGDGFDGRDELVFMGRDAQGSTASTSNWVGTPGVSTENVRYRITVRDAVKGQVGYIYAYVWKQEPSFLNSVDDYADWIQDDSNPSCIGRMQNPPYSDSACGWLRSGELGSQANLPRFNMFIAGNWTMGAMCIKPNATDATCTVTNGQTNWGCPSER